MKIKINDKAYEFEFNQISLIDLLERLNINSKYNVIAINFECISKSKYSEIEIKDGDEIEILSPMQGG
jgi:sulfur carrier protein